MVRTRSTFIRALFTEGDVRRLSKPLFLLANRNNIHNVLCSVLRVSCKQRAAHQLLGLERWVDGGSDELGNHEEMECYK